MRFSCNSANLASGIQIVTRIISSKTTLPILSGIMLDASEGDLRLATSDLEISMETRIEAEISEPGRCVLPAKYISELVRRLPNLGVTFTSAANLGPVQISCNSAEYLVNSMDPDQFPLLPEVPMEMTFRIPSEILSELTRRTAYAAAIADARAFLSGILIEASSGMLSMVATDTFRLSFVTAKVDGISGELKGIIVPAKVLVEVTRLAGNLSDKVGIAIGENRSEFTFGTTRIISRLIEGRFPNYRQVIPNGHIARIKISSRQFLEMVDRVSLLVRDDIGSVKLSVAGGVLTVTANSPDLGRAKEEISVDHEGEDAEVALKASYILDALKAIESENVIFDMTGTMSPVSIQGEQEEDGLHLIMPLTTA
ncbi:MAG TPA: DNA polymerase III subunit beta [Firmicutes bacterium]|nr:DNA polymerase III subunit beta [Bacillota bacterium]